jgi:hypothetical protein
MTDNEVIHKPELLQRIDSGWQTLQNFITGLSPDQREVYVDHVGWTVKDHLTHLMTWEDGIFGLLSKRPRWQQMNVDQALWAEMMRTQNFDDVNAVIQRNYAAKSFDEVMQMYTEIHERLMPMLREMTDEELHQQIFNIQPDFRGERPLVGLIIDDTYGHIEEHLPWMQAIANQS